MRWSSYPSHSGYIVHVDGGPQVDGSAHLSPASDRRVHDSGWVRVYKLHTTFRYGDLYPSQSGCLVRVGCGPQVDHSAHMSQVSESDWRVHDWRWGSESTYWCGDLYPSHSGCLVRVGCGVEVDGSAHMSRVLVQSGWGPIPLLFVLRLAALCISETQTFSEMTNFIPQEKFDVSLEELLSIFASSWHDVRIYGIWWEGKLRDHISLSVKQNTPCYVLVFLICCTCKDHHNKWREHWILVRLWMWAGWIIVPTSTLL